MKICQQLRSLSRWALVIGICANANADGVEVTVRTSKCDQGKILHPTGVSVNLFDAEKTPKLLAKATELKSVLKLVSSNPDAIGRVDTLYGELQKLVENTPALAKVRSLPRAEYVFKLPQVRKVAIFAFGRSEFEPFVYATQVVEVSSKHPNDLNVNFSSEEECRSAK